MAFGYDYQFRMLFDIVKLAGAEDTGVVGLLTLQLHHETVVAVGLHTGNHGSYIQIHKVQHGLIGMWYGYLADGFCSRLIGPVHSGRAPVAVNAADVQGVVSTGVGILQVAIVRIRIGLALFLMNQY